jgi:hypothetical protein
MRQGLAMRLSGSRVPPKRNPPLGNPREERQGIPAAFERCHAFVVALRRPNRPLQADKSLLLRCFSKTIADSNASPAKNRLAAVLTLMQVLSAVRV